MFEIATSSNCKNGTSIYLRVAFCGHLFLSGGNDVTKPKFHDHVSTGM